MLAYHDIVPEGEEPGGDLSLHLPQGAFAEQLDILVRTHDVVPLDQLLQPPSAPPSRPLAAITFDDAYTGAMTVGVAELARRGLFATVFVAPAFIGGGSFWWDTFASVDAGPAGAFRERAIVDARGQSDAVTELARAMGRIARVQPPHRRCASLAELRAAAGHISFGSHSWSHPNLVRLTDVELQEELARPLLWLRQHLSPVVPWLAYPYGVSAPRVERAAAAAGYTGAVLVSGGATRRPPRNCFAVPRLDVPGEVSPGGFALRVSGFLRR
ncbi:MAG: hypothetical protein NVS4B3_04940 [Gemmatimonadaceae bacterium]